MNIMKWAKEAMADTPEEKAAKKKRAAARARVRAAKNAKARQDVADSVSANAKRGGVVGSISRRRAEQRRILEELSK